MNPAFSLCCVVILNIIIGNKNMARIPSTALKLLRGKINGISREKKARLHGSA